MSGKRKSKFDYLSLRRWSFLLLSPNEFEYWASATLRWNTNEICDARVWTQRHMHITSYSGKSFFTWARMTFVLFHRKNGKRIGIFAIRFGSIATFFVFAFVALIIAVIWKSFKRSLQFTKYIVIFFILLVIEQLFTHRKSKWAFA